ncbi:MULTISPECIES: integrase core domain-containing protein [Streptomyces]|nr:integrase core domain-containing protein [Streptomyces canarius]
MQPKPHDVNRQSSPHPGAATLKKLIESQIGLYKTELIKPRRPWHDLADVELCTAERIDWFNNQRLHTAIGDIPPHEHETNHYAQLQSQRRLESTHRASTDSGAVHVVLADNVETRARQGVGGRGPLGVPGRLDGPPDRRVHREQRRFSGPTLLITPLLLGWCLG